MIFGWIVISGTSTVELRRTCRQAIMDRWIGKTAVVTGAASGIGEAITRALLRKGVNVVALDIQKEKLESLAEQELVAKKQEGFSGVLRPIHCDISVKEDIDAAFQQIDAYGGVDIMVNNAGVIFYSRVIGMSLFVLIPSVAEFTEFSLLKDISDYIFGELRVLPFVRYTFDHRENVIKIIKTLKIKTLISHVEDKLSLKKRNFYIFHAAYISIQLANKNY